MTRSTSLPPFVTQATDRRSLSSCPGFTRVLGLPTVDRRGMGAGVEEGAGASAFHAQQKRHARLVPGLIGVQIAMCPENGSVEARHLNVLPTAMLGVDCGG